VIRLYSFVPSQDEIFKPKRISSAAAEGHVRPSANMQLLLLLSKKVLLYIYIPTMIIIIIIIITIYTCWLCRSGGAISRTLVKKKNFK